MCNLSNFTKYKNIYLFSKADIQTLRFNYINLNEVKYQKQIIIYTYSTIVHNKDKEKTYCQTLSDRCSNLDRLYQFKYNKISKTINNNNNNTNIQQLFMNKSEFSIRTLSGYEKCSASTISYFVNHGFKDDNLYIIEKNEKIIKYTMYLTIIHLFLYFLYVLRIILYVFLFGKKINLGTVETMSSNKLNNLYVFTRLPIYSCIRKYYLYMNISRQNLKIVEIKTAVFCTILIND
ncbi:hypothetical protein KUTeg_013752 [Tegillarca granosa]|uniref:Uncharacterized protein n=1 Tax=Tegillarca granosa TaxID=220873 RepID=A0ABQ9EZZ9_TEGGR|nr:hypothetical protein KUTeg_013752 [Tegillarca granosa]